MVLGLGESSGRGGYPIKNQGAGMPDGGLFTQDQFNRKTGEPKDSALSARGVVEVKAPARALHAIAQVGIRPRRQTGTP